ncbi:helix-turn-helix domain-containing protein [Rubrivivax albus]|uniref:Putative Fis-like DNA-binding protein n=1 Tax=Rubrivivax albus TaxID=2499835 RepID=A0A437JZT8_9BURK|nr:helix-turn-helix domain-containing protein [Rubrivivax albus]RVT53616.1 Fis family transcriptional regulator [Rubrivivax albus]
MKLEDAVRTSLEAYFRDLRGAEPHGVQQMVLQSVEKPMLEVVLRHAEGNQRLAAEWLGINRNTLRRKLVEHGLID